MKLFPSLRPYWHVDAKWVFGILFVLCLFVVLLLATVIKLTDEDRGPKIAALTVGSLFIRGDSLGDIEEAKQALKEQGGVIRPIPTMPEITITEQDLTLSPADIKLKVFLPLTTILYSDGIEKTAERFATNSEDKQKFINDASTLRLFTKQTHDTLNGLSTVFIIVSVVFLLGVVYFSAGWGRLANPGLQLLVVSLPGTLLGLLLTNPPKDGDGGSLGFLPADITAELGAPIGEVYYLIALFGIALLLAALIGKVVSSIVKRHRPKTSSTSKSSNPSAG